MSSSSHNTKCGILQDGEVIFVKSGGTLQLESGSAVTLAGVDKTDEFAAALALTVKAGAYSMDADDATANSATIASGLASITTVICQVVDSGNNVVTSDADITTSSGNIVVADGSTFNVTDGYVVRWIAIGALA